MQQTAESKSEKNRKKALNMPVHCSPNTAAQSLFTFTAALHARHTSQTC